jgi:hypothetical protein
MRIFTLLAIIFHSFLLYHFSCQETTEIAREIIKCSINSTLKQNPTDSLEWTTTTRYQGNESCKHEWAYGYFRCEGVQHKLLTDSNDYNNWICTASALMERICRNCSRYEYMRGRWFQNGRETKEFLKLELTVKELLRQAHYIIYRKAFNDYQALSYHVQALPNLFTDSLVWIPYPTTEWDGDSSCDHSWVYGPVEQYESASHGEININQEWTCTNHKLSRDRICRKCFRKESLLGNWYQKTLGVQAFLKLNKEIKYKINPEERKIDSLMNVREKQELLPIFDDSTRH